jgi:cation diffusion facilitator CzcD-associated flavoprotein CzcO
MTQQIQLNPRLTTPNINRTLESSRSPNVAIIGAGPYGLSIAAHLKATGVPFRIFGTPMGFWRAHMPKGMWLKSDGFASNIYDPSGSLTLKQYCAERAIEYADMGIPVRLDTFTDYGLAFKERMVAEVEEKIVESLAATSNGFNLTLDNGETVTPRRVVVAVGIGHFKYMPPSLSNLPSEFVSHSSDHYDLEPFKNRSVAVIGAGASAIDLAGLLHQAGANVQLVTRRPRLHIHQPPQLGPRSLWEQVRSPITGVGPGWRARFYCDAPILFHFLPKKLRLHIVRKAIGPSAGWYMRDMVEGKVPQILSHTVERADVRNNRVHLHLSGPNAPGREVVVQHAIAATGYKVDLRRLTFLGSELRSRLKTVDFTPVLSTDFESSVNGLYFVGTASANSFGPVMRFAFGAQFTAPRLSRALAELLTSH